MARDRDNPIREYFEEDAPYRIFLEKNKQLQTEIDRNQGWDREAFKKEYTSLAGGLTRVIQTWRNGGLGISFVRWNGCLWHLLIRIRVNYDRERRILTRWAVSACGEEFPVGEMVEGKVDTEPHQAFTCMVCWEDVRAMQIALILGEEE